MTTPQDPGDREQPAPFPSAPPPPPEQAPPTPHQGEVSPNVFAPPLSAADMGGGGPVGQAPQELRIAFFLWIALAVLQVVAAVLAFSSRDAAIDVARTANAGLTEEQLQTTVTTVLAFFSLIYVVFAVLLVLFAVKVRAGKGWARTALVILGVIVFLFEARLDPVGAVTGLLIIGGIVLMNLRPSSDFIKAQRPA